MTLRNQLSSALHKALSTFEIPPEASQRVGVTAAKDLRFGDYQSNAAMVLAKVVRKNPRELAQAILGSMDLDGLAEGSIAGPGFLNFKVTPEAFAQQVLRMAKDERCGVERAAEPQTYLLDFSSPNIAKPMHVGHIRSTIIGESLSRIGRFLGHQLITDNHIGDWGTQFGMVIWAWKADLDRSALTSAPLQELLRLYRLGSQQSKADEATAIACRTELVKLQQGDPENTAIWKEAVALSVEGLKHLYERLDVHFDHWLGESAYHEALPSLVSNALQSGLARKSDGAVCIFSSEEKEPKQDPFKKRDEETKEWTDFPMIIQKSDGAYNYATTDLATLEYRAKRWNPDHLLYVVDHRQAQHFEQLFDVAARTNYLAKLHHVAFGTICGTDGKPLKTRSGDLPQLADVLDEAVEAATQIVEEKSYLEDPEARQALAETIGLAAVKFTELSHNRQSDYIFDLQKMVALEGDTAPYLMYSHVRPLSILRKLETPFSLPDSLLLEDEQELHLARMLCRFAEVLPTVYDDFRPNLLTAYLLELARSFHRFFESCPVLPSSGETRQTRLALCDTTAQVLHLGLELLGIEAPEKM